MGYRGDKEDVVYSEIYRRIFVGNKMEIKSVKVDKIRPYEHNPRKNDDAVKLVANSIREFGWKQPIVVDKDGVIVAGHTRYKAALQLGMDTVPCLIADDLSPEQIRAYRLADNKTNDAAEWDFDELDLELSELDGFFDMADFGFDDADAADPQNNADCDDYDADDRAEKLQAKAKRGDLYSLGSHRLMCGDSTSAEDIQLLMDRAQADMVFTDPPYGVAIGDKNKALNSVQKAGCCCENIENDTLDDESLYEMLKKAFINAREACAEDAVYYVTAPQNGSLGLMMMMMMMRDAGLPVRHVLMWRKNSATFSLGRLDYDYQHEPILYTWVNKHHNYRKGENRTTVWDYDKPRKCDLHPTMKPVELVENAILDGTQKGDTVLDLFGGSGTTMIACEKLGRSCRMMELDPHYADVIIDRWEQLTGGKAVLLNG